MWSKKVTGLTIAIVAVFLGCFSQPSEGLRILGIFPVNSKSHYSMCEQLAKGLAGKGYQIDVFSHFPLKNQVSNYKHFSLEGSLPQLSNNLSYDEAVGYQQGNPQKVIGKVGTNLCELLDLPVFQELRKSLTRDSPYDLVIVETFLSNCFYGFGRLLNIPMVGVMPTTLIDWYNEALGNPLNTAVTPSMSSDYYAPMDFWQRLLNTLKGKFVGAIFQYYLREQDSYVERYFGPGYPDVIEMTKDLDLLLVNIHHSIDGIRPVTPAVVPVAGLHILNDDTKPPERVQKWLDDSKNGCIYFSFGSMVRIETFPKQVVEIFYATFKNIAPVRVLLKIAKPNELPAGLPANVMTQSWFPQEQVLKHKNTKAFVTHGGLMSTQEAIYYGVPLIGVPLFGDQHTNMEVNVRRGIAINVKLNNVTEKKFTTAIKEVLYNPAYETNVDKLSKMFVDRPMKPLDEAIFWVEYIARHGKKALRSPLVDLAWWQANLLDVYGFVLLILFIGYYILKQLLKAVLKICCPSKGQVSTGARNVSKSKKIR